MVLTFFLKNFHNLSMIFKLGKYGGKKIKLIREFFTKSCRKTTNYERKQQTADKDEDKDKDEEDGKQKTRIKTKIKTKKRRTTETD